jgi:hypothetical protein
VGSVSLAVLADQLAARSLFTETERVIVAGVRFSHRR